MGEKFGFESGEAEQSLENMSKIVDPDDIDDMYDEVDRYLKKEINNYMYEIRIYHKDGSVLWTRHKATAIFDSQNNAVRMIGRTVDIIEEYKQKEINKQTNTGASGRWSCCNWVG